MPTAEEQARAVQEDSLTVADTIARLRQQIESDDAVRADVLARAARDALGRLPTDDEIAAWSGEPRGATYAERMERRLAWLAERPAEYERVIQRAYRVVVRRDAYPEEIEYWRARGTLSFVLLVGCVEDWARRNQPGLMVTAGRPTVSLNSEFLTTLRLEPRIAFEARAAAGLREDNLRLAVAAGHNLIAAGAEPVVTRGRIHLVAAGSARLARWSDD